MTLQQSITRGAASGVAIGATPKSLSAIQKPDCAAAIWQREPLDAFQNWIDGLAHHELPKARILLRPNDVHPALTNLVNSHALAPSEERTMLVEDIAALAHIFASIMDTPYVRLRLDVINTNACRKFHIDRMKARLICTYRGTGTQYGVSEVGDDPKRIFTTPTGSPIMLRGHLWPATAAPDLLHRSPPIEGTGEMRLMLALDPIVDLQAARREEFLH